jgi:hypothetical protein
MANLRPKNIVQSDGDYPAGVGEQLRIGRRDPPGSPSNKIPRRAETAGGGGGVSPAFYEAPGKTGVGSLLKGRASSR